MDKYRWTTRTALVVISAVALLAGCGSSPAARKPDTPPVTSPAQPVTPAPGNTDSGKTPTPTVTPTQPATGTGSGTATTPGEAGHAFAVVANPSDIHVLVNKKFALPSGWEPSDLVEPNVPFTFTEHVEKREMRKEAAQALEQMFAAAKKDGIQLAGVSGYRSYATQTSLYNYYVKTYGQDWTDRYSAFPGTSEHETGLAIDVSDIDGKCQADDCFGDTPDAKWLAQHVADYGFIIRYPKGKEAITGYAYEPWHIRYVGLPMSQQVMSKGLTLEEFLGHAN